MAKLYFKYSVMNSGKSTALLQAAYNYEERGMEVVIIKPRIDSKGDVHVVSRLGLDRRADLLLVSGDDVNQALDPFQDIHCVLIDEAQFLTPQQIDQLFWYAVNGNVPVLAYGLRTDFSTAGFPGATRLLELAHEITEPKSICRCGRKAVLNGRKRNGSFIFSGEQVVIDGEDNIEYESLCGGCYQQFKNITA
jgi:thymidine kinase